MVKMATASVSENLLREERHYLVSREEKVTELDEPPSYARSGSNAEWQECIARPILHKPAWSELIRILPVFRFENETTQYHVIRMIAGAYGCDVDPARGL